MRLRLRFGAASPSRQTTMHIQRCAVPLLLAISAAAQIQYETSPKGLLTTEGNAVFYHWNQGRRLQQADATWTGVPRILQSLAFRRDGNGGGQTGKTIDITLKLGLANMSRLSGDFDQNFLATPVTAFAKKPVSMPDWSTPLTPGPFDFVMTLDAPYIYLATNALLIDVVCENPSPTQAGTTDRDYTFYTSNTGSIVGSSTGCTTANGTFTHNMALETNGPALPKYGQRIKLDAKGAPSAAVALLSLDAVDRNLSITGICTSIHALSGVILPLGPTSASGTIAPLYLAFPFNTGIEGAPLLTQLIAQDPSQPGLPFALSDARQATMPTASQSTGHECAYMWQTLTGGPASFVFYGGGLVIRLGY